jgi:hypothetical protein
MADFSDIEGLVSWWMIEIGRASGRAGLLIVGDLCFWWRLLHMQGLLNAAAVM